MASVTQAPILPSSDRSLSPPPLSLSLGGWGSIPQTDQLLVPNQPQQSQTAAERRGFSSATTMEITDIVCLVAPLVMLAGSTLQADVKSVKEAEKTGNFMEDEQWLSTISQYSRKIKHWNRFRDVSPPCWVRGARMCGKDAPPGKHARPFRNNSYCGASS